MATGSASPNALADGGAIAAATNIARPGGRGGEDTLQWRACIRDTKSTADCAESDGGRRREAEAPAVTAPHSERQHSRKPRPGSCDPPSLAEHARGDAEQTCEEDIGTLLGSAPAEVLCQPHTAPSSAPSPAMTAFGSGSDEVRSRRRRQPMVQPALASAAIPDGTGTSTGTGPGTGTGTGAGTGACALLPAERPSRLRDNLQALEAARAASVVARSRLATTDQA